MEKAFIIENQDYISRFKMATEFERRFKEIMNDVAKLFDLKIEQYYLNYDVFSPILTNEQEELMMDRGYLTKQGKFKKNSAPNKCFVERMALVVPKSRPSLLLNFNFHAYGKSNSRQFIWNDVMYGWLQNDNLEDISHIEGIKEIKLSEYYKVIEEIEEANKKA